MKIDYKIENWGTLEYLNNILYDCRIDSDSLTYKEVRFWYERLKLEREKQNDN